MIRLIKSEILKFRTTRAWWQFLAGFVFVSLAALYLNGAGNFNDLHPNKDVTNYAALLVYDAHVRTPAGTAALAANLMTSGQFVTVLIAMLIGSYLATTEFTEHTATSAFLVTPRRERVIAAKVATAALLAVACWVISTAMNTIATPIFLSTQHLNPSIAGWTVAQTVLLSLAAFIVWAMFGLGLGALIRSQTTTAVAGIGIYAGGFVVAQLLFGALYTSLHQNWLRGMVVISPAVASRVMLTPGSAFSYAPPQWAGALIMVAYTAVLAGAGALRTLRRDVG